MSDTGQDEKAAGGAHRELTLDDWKREFVADCEAGRFGPGGAYLAAGNSRAADPVAHAASLCHPVTFAVVGETETKIIEAAP